MGDRRRLLRPLRVGLAVAWALGLALQAQQPAAPPANAKIWVGRAAEIEQFVRTTPIVKMEDLSVGVTHPKKATLPPGGPVQYLAWKAIPPARYSGYWESYLSEIAAYELDKLLQLNMVPPTVEREYKNDKGAAVMWASPTRSFKEFGGKGAPDAPPIYAAAWAKQIAQAKMFDNLINNLDPNLGNWLVDPSWNLILIDHTRAFTGGTTMIHQMTHIDPDLWARMRALDEPTIQSTLGKWLVRGGAKTLIQRRDKMQQIIDALVKAQGADNVFIRSHE
jgi:hypothetical protein